MWPIGGIFAYSGGAQYAIDSINTAPVKQLDESRGRTDDVPRPLERSPPVQPLRARRPDVQGRRASRSRRRRCSCTASRTRRSAGDAGRRVQSSDSSAASRPRGRGTRRAARGCAPRFERGTVVDVDGNDVPIAPKNVVVMFVHYVGGDAGGSRRPKPSSPAPARCGCSPAARSSRARGRGPTRRSRRSSLDANGQRDPLDARPDLGRAPRRRPTR